MNFLLNNQILFGKTEIKSLSPPIFQWRAADDALEILAEEGLGRETEIHYEYIINRHLYLSTHAGISMILKSGLYTKNRKEVETVSASGTTAKGPIVEQDRSPVPFVNVGISYSLFK